MKALLSGLVVTLVGGVAVLWYDSTQAQPVSFQMPVVVQQQAGGAQQAAGPGIWFRGFTFDGTTWYENFADGSKTALPGPPP